MATDYQQYSHKTKQNIPSFRYTIMPAKSKNKNWKVKNPESNPTQYKYNSLTILSKFHTM